MQKRLAGRNPNCAVRIPMTHMIILFAPAMTQPCQCFFPTRTVERMVKKQDRKSSLSIFRPWHGVSVCLTSSREQFTDPRDDMVVVGGTGAANVELRLAAQGSPRTSRRGFTSSSSPLGFRASGRVISSPPLRQKRPVHDLSRNPHVKVLLAFHA